jgi:serine/threonine protein kinase
VVFFSRSLTPHHIFQFKRAVLSDFGLSHQLPLDVLEYRPLPVGHVAPATWTAPEAQFPDRVYSRASDVFSFSMLLYEALVGIVPFHDTAGDIAAFIRKGQRPAVPASACVPEYLVRLMQDCWEQNPDARPQMTEVRERLQRWRRATENDASARVPFCTHSARSVIGTANLSLYEGV